PETSGLRSEPAPYVLQRALDDFYVSYELVASVTDPVQRPLVASELYARIQDRFNAAGVQIMSPHYMLQPAKPVLAPAEAKTAAATRGPAAARRGSAAECARHRARPRRTLGARPEGAVMRATATWTVVLAGALGGGCAGNPTQILNPWKDPTAQPLTVKAGDTVVAMVISKAESTRRSGEIALAAELERHGVKAVPSYTIVPTEDVMNRDAALARI